MLSRELDRTGVYPPINVLPSLSRLMKEGIGKGYTHPDHPALANQLFASYARRDPVRVLASVVGDDGLSDADRRYLTFGDRVRAQTAPPGPCAHAGGQHGGRLGTAARAALC